MIDLYLVFRFVEGNCHGNQLIFGKCHERRLIPLAFFALSFENEFQYHCLYVRANSRDDVAISCKNSVNFCRVIPEIMELIWERQVRHGQKTSVFHWIPPDILDGFSQHFSPYESALRADDGYVPYFPTCQGTLPWQPNDIAIMKANWYYVHSLHVCQMVAGFWFATTC